MRDTEQTTVADSAASMIRLRTLVAASRKIVHDSQGIVADSRAIIDAAHDLDAKLKTLPIIPKAVIRLI